MRGPNPGVAATWENRQNLSPEQRALVEDRFVGFFGNIEYWG